MLQLTAEQYAKLCLPDPSDLVLPLAAELRRDHPSTVVERHDAELQADVRASYQHAVNHLHITGLPILVDWVKADVAWARGLRDRAVTCVWFHETGHPNATAADLLALLSSTSLAD